MTGFLTNVAFYIVPFLLVVGAVITVHEFGHFLAAKAALAAGCGAPAVLNAADEVAVAAFLDRRIGFLDIARVVAETLERMERDAGNARVQDDVLEAARTIDATARRVAGEVVSALMAQA